MYQVVSHKGGESQQGESGPRSSNGTTEGPLLTASLVRVQLDGVSTGLTTASAHLSKGRSFQGPDLSSLQVYFEQVNNGEQSGLTSQYRGTQQKVMIYL